MKFNCKHSMQLGLLNGVVVVYIEVCGRSVVTEKNAPMSRPGFPGSEYYNVVVTVAYGKHESQSIPKRFDEGRLIIKQTVLFDAKMNAFAIS